MAKTKPAKDLLQTGSPAFENLYWKPRFLED